MLEPLDQHERMHAGAWRRELRDTLRLASPIVVVQLGMIAFGTVDVMMVGHYSGRAMAAVALGHVFIWGLMGFGYGVLSALDPVISQAVGARDEGAIRRGVQRGLVLAVLLSLPLSVLGLSAESVLGLLQQPDDLLPIAGAYAVYSLPGILPFFLFVALRTSLQSLSRVAPIVWIILIANVANVALNRVLIFGELGFPEMGATGSAIASVVSRWLMAIGLFAFSLPILKDYLVPFERRSLRLDRLGQLFWIGVPFGFQFLLEMGAFASTALFMGWIGEDEIAGHQIALNLASMSFMIPVGVSVAASVRVGQAIGRGDTPGMRRAAAVALAFGAGVMCLFAVLFLALPGTLASLYTDASAVLAVATVLIPLAGVFQVFDGLQVVCVGILRGMGETRTAMLVNLIGFWMIGIPAGLYLAFELRMGPAGLWWGLVLALIAVAVILVARVALRLRGEVERIDLDAGPAKRPSRSGGVG